ncbi:hypothetical protein P7C70_g3628, partial [Phenoliferia sp. Uapishka_3]
MGKKRSHTSASEEFSPSASYHDHVVESKEERKERRKRKRSERMAPEELELASAGVGQEVQLEKKINKVKLEVINSPDAEVEKDDEEARRIKKAAKKTRKLAKSAHVEAEFSAIVAPSSVEEEASSSDQRHIGLASSSYFSWLFKDQSVYKRGKKERKEARKAAKAAKAANIASSPSVQVPQDVPTAGQARARASTINEIECVTPSLGEASDSASIVDQSTARRLRKAAKKEKKATKAAAKEAADDTHPASAPTSARKSKPHSTPFAQAIARDNKPDTKMNKVASDSTMTSTPSSKAKLVSSLGDVNEIDDGEFRRRLNNSGNPDGSISLNGKPTSNAREPASSDKRGLPVITFATDGTQLYDGSSLRDWFACQSSTSGAPETRAFLKTQGVATKEGSFTPSEDGIIAKSLEDWAALQSIGRADVLDIISSKDTKSTSAFWFYMTRSLEWRRNHSVREHVRAVYSPHARKGKWTEEENQALLDAVKVHGTSWSIIGEIVGRVPMLCQSRWKGLQEKTKTVNRAVWTSEQCSFLESAVDRLGKRWAQISREPEMSGKTPVQKLLTGTNRFLPALREVLANAMLETGFTDILRIEWPRLQARGLAKYSETRLRNAWMIMSKAAEADGISSSDLRAQLAWAAKRYHVAPSGRGVAAEAGVSKSEGSESEVDDEEDR